MDVRKRLLRSTIVRAKVDDKADMFISVRTATVITAGIKTGTGVTFLFFLFNKQEILGKKKIPHTFRYRGFL